MVVTKLVTQRQFSISYIIQPVSPEIVNVRSLIEILSCRLLVLPSHSHVAAYIYIYIYVYKYKYIYRFKFTLYYYVNTSSYSWSNDKICSIKNLNKEI